MDFKRIIHKPKYFVGKSLDDIEIFIKKFEVIGIINECGDTEK